MNIETTRDNSGIKIAVIIVVALGAVMFSLGIIFLSATGLLQYFLKGPTTVMNVPSPDGRFVAYVEEAPSIDPPNQSLYVELNDKKHFMFIAKLGEDVDAINQIIWSPDSSFVIFYSWYYLTATRVSDWQTVQIYLGDVWVRNKPDRKSVFSTTGQRQVIEEITFPEPGTFSYKIKGSITPTAVNMNTLSTK